MRPNDEPAFGVEEIYYQMYLLAIGIQMAGPNLTPQTFEAGMFAYPGGSGPRGLWGFGAGRLHAHRRLPRDLVGPEPHLGAEQQEGRVGAAQRRRPLVAQQAARPARPASSRRAEVAELEHAPVSTNGSTPHVDDREAGLDALRTQPENVHLFRGYGPLIVGAVLFVLMLCWRRRWRRSTWWSSR